MPARNYVILSIFCEESFIFLSTIKILHFVQDDNGMGVILSIFS